MCIEIMMKQIVYISSNMELLVLLNYKRIIYNKVFENSTKTNVSFISTYNLLWFWYSFKKGRLFLEGGVIATNAPLSYATRKKWQKLLHLLCIKCELHKCNDLNIYYNNICLSTGSCLIDNIQCSDYKEINLPISYQ